tara:strand:+ start:266 stop:451 length:186 start_codon:yes stop_codon:yes gene_type:complete
MIIDNLSPLLIPYDKNGKYYRQPTNSVNKDKKPSNTTTNKQNQNRLHLQAVISKRKGQGTL